MLQLLLLLLIAEVKHDETPQHADHTRDTNKGGLHDYHKKHQETEIGVDIDYLCGFIHVHTFILELKSALEISKNLPPTDKHINF